jgi:hypothetical protein
MMLKIIPSRHGAPTTTYLEASPLGGDDCDRQRGESNAGSQVSADQSPQASESQSPTCQDSVHKPDPKPALEFGSRPEALHRQRSIFDTPPPSPPP